MRTICADLHIPRVLAARVLSKVWNGGLLCRFSPTRFIEQPDPPLSSPRQVRVRNRLATICGTDLHIYRNEYMSDFPLIPGHEFAGTVMEVGKAVKNFQVGDRRICSK